MNIKLGKAARNMHLSIAGPEGLKYKLWNVLCCVQNTAARERSGKEMKCIQCQLYTLNKA